MPLTAMWAAPLLATRLPEKIGPSRKPKALRENAPALAATTPSYPLTAAYGPVGPNPLIEQ